MGHVSKTSLPAPDHATRLREALLAAAFTADGLLDLLGAPAYAALARSETVPALRATRGEAPLDTLVRLFLLQRPVPAGRAAAVLPLPECVADGWLTESDGEVRASVDVRPYGGPDGQDWFIVSDLGCAVGGAGGIGSHEEGVVLGIGGASTTLAGITVRRPVATALDIGTGSGIQALHASQHATRVTATDLNPRALGFTRLTLALSGAAPADLREGSLYEPVAGETYDLIVSNPPFVISPGARLTYRDGGMAGDDLCRTLVQQTGERLNEGGYAHFLANWQHTEDEEWQDRLRSWVPHGCDAWIVQREVQDVTQYAELWLRDSGDHRTEPHGVRGAVRRLAGRVRGQWDQGRRVRLDHAAEVRRGGRRRRVDRDRGVAARGGAAARSGHRGALRPSGLPAATGRRGAADRPFHAGGRGGPGAGRAAWRGGPRARGAPSEPRYAARDEGRRGGSGVRRCVRRIAVEAGRILDAIAQLMNEDPVLLRDRTPQAIRLLVEEGFLEPVPPAGRTAG